MRLMPVVGAGVARVANKQLQLGEYTIPRNTIVWVPLLALQTSPALWAKPDDFIPVCADYLHSLVPYTPAS
jgi:cytochrome P450